MKWKKSQEHSFHVTLPLQNPPQRWIFTCKCLNYLRKNRWRHESAVTEHVGRLAHEARCAAMKERSRWMDVLTFKLLWAAHAWVSAPQLHERLKTYLFVEAEKLTVAYPTVQHAVHMDVVGLEEKMEMYSITLIQLWHSSSACINKVKSTVVIPEHRFYD